MTTMSGKLKDLTELEKSFLKAADIGAVQEPLVVLAEPKKRIKIRECGDLRYWWDENCGPACDQLETAG